MPKFVQFPHPGTEHHPDLGYGKSWNTLIGPDGRERPHRRTFLEADGRWVNGVDARDVKNGKLWAWAEWEPEAALIHPFLHPPPQHPRYLFQPYWVPKDDYNGFHNTDPFIFGGFYYTDCKQRIRPGLRQLEQGTIIVFGSVVARRWVVDTVFVVRDYIDHTFANYEVLLADAVPDWDCYRNVVLCPTYQNGPAAGPRRFYRGATYDNRVNDMFSFFPCRPAGGEQGFSRPALNLPQEFFNVRLGQGVKGLRAPPLNIETLQCLWRSIVEQVTAHGCALGVYAHNPPQQDI